MIKCFLFRGWRGKGIQQQKSNIQYDYATWMFDISPTLIIKAPDKEEQTEKVRKMS